MEYGCVCADMANYGASSASSAKQYTYSCLLWKHCKHFQSNAVKDACCTSSGNIRLAIWGPNLVDFSQENFIGGFIGWPGKFHRVPGKISSGARGKFHRLFYLYFAPFWENFIGCPGKISSGGRENFIGCPGKFHRVLHWVLHWVAWFTHFSRTCVRVHTFDTNQ